MKQQKAKPRRRTGERKCFFCERKSDPDYKEWEVLRRFITERGKIISQGRTGPCFRHQKKLTQEIKRARYLALLPFVTQV